MSAIIKVVHVTQALGGVKTHIEHIFKYSKNSGLRYVLIAPFDASLDELCKELKIEYHVLNIKREFNLFSDLYSLFKITQIIRKENPALVHCHSAKGGFLGRLAAQFCSKKTIYTPNGLAYLSFTGIKRMIFYLFEYVAKKWTNMLVAVSYSEANRGFFELGYKFEKVRVVLNSIPIADDFMPSYDKTEHVGMIARLTYQKNPILFLRIADELLKTNPKLSFSILGAGLHDHLGKEVYAYIQDQGLEEKVKILPWSDSNTSHSYLQEVDIFVMTSAFEGLPYSLLEAMALGVPCIVSKADGNSDVIQNNENGFSCLGLEEYLQRIGLLIADQQLKQKIGFSGKEYIKAKHNIETNIISLESIYFNMLDNRLSTF